MPSAARKRAGLGLGLALLCVSLVGCARQAPGPDECERFATAVVLQNTESSYLTAEMQQQIDEATRVCLTVPYDRALLSCVLTTNRAKPCLEGFRRRTGRTL